MSKARSSVRAAWSWHHLFAAINATIACAAVLGQLPGQVAYLPLSYSLAGQIECVSAAGWTGWRGCADLGVPLGLPMLNAGPLVWIGALLNILPGVSAHAAGQATLTTASGIALLATAAVLRRLGTSSAAAVVGGVAWLLTPTVVGLRYFNGTWSGLTLLPAFLLADVVLLERLRRTTARGVTVVLVAYTAVRCAAFFLDAYGFVISGLVSVGVLVLWPGPRGSRRTVRFGAVGTAALANSVAFLAYKSYVPHGSATYPSPMSQFRALGADVTSFVRPSRDVWWADLAGVTRSSVRMWGDGTNIDANYLGALCLCLCVAGLIGPLRRSGHASALTAVAVMALALSLGPSLKVGAERGSDRPVEHGHDWYEMPAEDGITLPTSVLFARVPGLSTMRATYRWVTATRLVLVLAAVVAVDAALRRGGSRVGRGAVLAVAALAVVELLPPVPRLISEHSTRRAQLRAFHQGPVRELRRVVDPGHLVLFLPVDNDYLANYLVPMAGLRSYNVGGDKNGHAARARWPVDVASLVVSHRSPSSDVGARAVKVLEEQADALVLPRFSLRRDARSWPPSVRPVPAPFHRLLTDRRLVVEQHRWFVVIRLASSS